jgi:hypothetical protein
LRKIIKKKSFDKIVYMLKLWILLFLSKNILHDISYLNKLVLELIIVLVWAKWIGLEKWFVKTIKS